MSSVTTDNVNKSIHPYTKLKNSYRQNPVTNSSHTFIIILIFIIIVILLILVTSLIKWFLNERRLRELRHRLIPLYTFDPNDDDDWEAELLSQDQSIFSQISQDYNSMNSYPSNE